MNAIYKFVLGLIGKRSGVITTLPNKKQIEFQTNMLAEKFMQNGIDPNALKSPEQVKNVLANIDQANMRVIPADSAEGASISRGLGIAKKADVMDMEGNKIDTSKGIMGGKEINQKTLNEELMKTDNAYSDLVNTPRPRTLAEREADVLAGMEKNNKEMVQRIRERKKVDDSIAKIKSMEPMEAMKEANLVAGKKGRYANLDDNQVKKIMDDTQDHIFQDADPIEDLAIGGRVGLKGGTFLNFIKNIGKGMNNKSPLQAYKDYLKSVKDRAQKGDMKTLAPELGIIAGGGILTNRFLKKKLEKMTEDAKAEVEKKADGGRIGLFMGSAYPKGAAALREMLKLFGKKSDSVKNPSDILRIVNPKQFNKTLEDPSIYRKFDVEKGIGAPDMIRNIQKKMTSDRQSTVKEMLDAAKNIKKSDDTTLRYKNEMIEELMAKGADRKMAEEMAETISKMAENAAGKSNTPKLTDEGILQLENILKNMETGGKKPRDLNADGGRIGLKGGGADFEMSNSDKEFEAYKNYLMNEGMIQGDRQLRDQMEKHKKKLMEKRYGIAVADGGRIGYKAGSVDKMRRLILKAIGAGTAGIATAKSGIFSLGKGAGKTVAKEVAQQTTSSMPPPYFFKLAEKIKNMGNDVTATTDRTIAKSLKSKDGKSEYLLEQDVSTGDTIIKKINKEGDDMITDVEIMDFKKGEVVIGKDGKAVKTLDEYEEVTEANARIEGDVFNDPYYTDGIEVDEIIKEVDDKVPSIKYASGGLAYMLGE